MSAASSPQQLSGIVTILARHGKVVEEKTHGKKDIASGAAMTRDTIFRIYLMTKPVTGVAMMILYEEGKWHPSDPLSKYIPEFRRRFRCSNYLRSGRAFDSL
jgi:CubicO group peptidase (beta-lactamase class C family)